MLSGDLDLAAVGALVADETRCRILLALDDGRALPAGRLAAEAGVRASTTSGHLGKLVDGGLLAVETHGRHRYYRLAGPEVGALIETMGGLARPRTVGSLREHTRAGAMRRGRTCYDHLAGKLGVALMRSFIDSGWISGGDGHHRAESGDPRAGFGSALEYALSESGRTFVDEFGVDLPGGRPTVRYCVDWTEQHHHLAGGLGRGLRDRLLALEWIRAGSTRAVSVTPAGHRGLRSVFGVETPISSSTTQ